MHSLGLNEVIPPFDPMTVTMHKFKFLDDDINSSEGGGGNSVPSTGICDRVSSYWDSGEPGMDDNSNIGTDESIDSSSTNTNSNSNSGFFDAPDKKRIKS